MGDIVGGIVGGIGSIFGGQQAAAKEDEAAKSAMTGYNYLAGNPLINQAQGNAQLNIAANNNATQAQGATLGNIGQLLTSGTQSPAYQNYLNSTGYQFQVGQGEQAITNNAAAKGLLNSGATAKGLTQYGQNAAAQSFNNYLGQMSGLAGGYGGLAQNYQANINSGLNAATATGQAGTTGGANAGAFQAQAGQSLGTSTANAFNIGGGTVQNALPSASNFFSGGSSVPLPSFY